MFQSLTPTFWLILGIVLLTLEVVTPGFVVCFFGVGAVAVGLITLVVGIPESWQLLLFATLSVASLITVRRRMRRMFTGKKSGESDGLGDDCVGQTATVIAPVGPKVAGKVEFQGSGWMAVADEELPPGTPVRIVSRDGLTLGVQRR